MCVRSCWGDDRESQGSVCINKCCKGAIVNRVHVWRIVTVLLTKTIWSHVSIFHSNSRIVLIFWQFFNGVFLGLVAKLNIKPSHKLETKTMWAWRFLFREIYWFKRGNVTSTSKWTFYIHYNSNNSCIKMIIESSNCHVTCVLHCSNNYCSSEQFLDLSWELTRLTNLNLFQTLLTYLVMLVVFSFFNCYINLQAQ